MTNLLQEDEETSPKTKEPADERIDVAKAARLRLALTAGSEELFDLLQDPDQEIVRSLFRNPQLSEEHLLSLLKRRDLSEGVLRSIQRSPAGGSSGRVRIALASHPKIPAAVLSQLLPQLFLFELVALLQRPGVAADQKLAAERAIVKRLPETEFGNKITLARRGSPGLLEALLKGGEPQVVDAVLANPKLKEAGVLAFINSAAATAETISTVARHRHWGSRPNLRYAMLRNRKTPRIWFTLFLPGLATSQVRDLLQSRELTPEQLAEVREELQKRSPGKLELQTSSSQ